jgi:hypothetical protein
LPDIIIAELQRTQNVPPATTVEKITFQLMATDDLVDEWLDRQLLTSYTESFV